MLNPEEKYIIKINKNNEGKGLRQATVESSGYDLPNGEKEKTILPGQIQKINTGIKLLIPKEIEGHIYSRTGNTKRGLVVAGGIGICDSDYRGEIFVLLQNISQQEIIIKKGEYIAQMIFREKIKVLIEITEENISEIPSERGTKCLGSSDN